MLYHEYQKLIKNYINLLGQGLGNSLTIVSPAGYGKTTLILNSMKEYPQNSYLYLNGYITPLEFYVALWRTIKLQPPKFLILDDMEFTLQDKKIQILLKGATADLGTSTKRIVYYISLNKNVENIPKLEFDGKIIILLNEFPKKNKQLKAILDRTIFLNLKMDKDEVLQSAKEEIIPKEFGTLTLEERKEVFDFIENNIPLYNEISFRTIIQGFKCYEYYKQTQEDWQQLLLSILENKNYR